MRQLKTFMRNRKAEMLGCGPCVCRTLQCWRYASENCGCGEGTTEDMISSILNWFKNTSVYNDLSAENKEQALADAQEILEGAGDGIAPFYNAVRQGRTFANYAERMGLDVDESGPCDSSLYEDEEAFIIYISTAGAIHCKYLALVARRGRTPRKELINKEAISDYLDWVTTEEVTYQFKDWDDEILSFGSVKKGETPTAPTDLPPRPNYRFTGWSPNVGKIEYDTTFVAQYVYDVIPVASVSNIPDHIQAIKLGESSTYTFNYAPANANDFGNLNLVDVCNCYDEPIITSSVVYDNGVATVTASYPVEQQDTSGGVEVWLNGEQVGVTLISGGTYPIEWISNVPESYRVNVGDTTTLTFNYSPEYANDLTNLEISDWADTYSDTHTSSTLSCNNGVGTITTTGTLEGFGEIGCRLNEDVDTIKGRVLPAGMEYVVEFDVENGYGYITINDGTSHNENGQVYANEHGMFYVDGDDLIVANDISYSEENSTYLHPHAGDGYEFVGWFYDPSGSYEEHAKVHTGDRIEEDVIVYACFKRA